jgi:hypothetical protein
LYSAGSTGEDQNKFTFRRGCPEVGEKLTERAAQSLFMPFGKFTDNGRRAVDTKGAGELVECFD